MTGCGQKSTYIYTRRQLAPPDLFDGQDNQFSTLDPTGPDGCCVTADDHGRIAAFRCSVQYKTMIFTIRTENP